MFYQSPSVIPAHTPGTYDTSRAPHLRVSLVVYSASYFAGAAHGISEALSPLVTPSTPACGRTSPAQVPSPCCFPPLLWTHTPASCGQGGTRNNNTSRNV